MNTDNDYEYIIIIMYLQFIIRYRLYQVLVARE